MTVAIPLAFQPDYTELRYSLRSLQKFLPAPFEVLIIGDHIPEWLTGVTQINLADIPGRKQLSIRRKILAALEYSKQILFFNDDMYFLRPAETFPYYWHGMLKTYSESGARPLEKEIIAVVPGAIIKHFDGHYPLIYYKQDFNRASKHFSDNVIIKSMYCNYLGIGGTFAPDCKLLRDTKPEIIREFIKDKPCFSTGTHSLKSALPILQELFFEPSKYEI